MKGMPPLLQLVWRTRRSCNDLASWPSDLHTYLQVHVTFPDNLVFQVLAALLKEPTTLKQIMCRLKDLPVNYEAADLAQCLLQGLLHCQANSSNLSDLVGVMKICADLGLVRRVGTGSISMHEEGGASTPMHVEGGASTPIFYNGKGREAHEWTGDTRKLQELIQQCRSSELPVMNNITAIKGFVVKFSEFLQKQRQMKCLSSSCMQAQVVHKVLLGRILTLVKEERTESLDWCDSGVGTKDLKSMTPYGSKALKGLPEDWHAEDIEQFFEMNPLFLPMWCCLWHDVVQGLPHKQTATALAEHADVEQLRAARDSFETTHSIVPCPAVLLQAMQQRKNARGRKRKSGEA